MSLGNKGFDRMKKRQIKKLILLVLVMMLAIPVQAKAAGMESAKGSAIVDTDNLNIRSGPGTDYSALGKVSTGESFDVTAVSDEWVEIDYYGDKGYLSMNYVVYEPLEEEIIEDEPEVEEADSKDLVNTDTEEVPEVGEESAYNYKLIFGLIGAIVVVFLVILLTIKSLKDMDYDDDDDDYYEDDEYDEDEYDEDEYDDDEYEEDDEYDEDEYYEDDDDDDEYEYVTIRRPKNPQSRAPQRQPQSRQPQRSQQRPPQRQQYSQSRQAQRPVQKTAQKPKKSDDDFLIDIDPRYFD